jgi:NitT/TauT family transport system ATP-binding protein
MRSRGIVAGAPRLPSEEGARPAVLEIKSLSKTYGSRDRATRAIGDVSFTVEDREFVCVVGPSGCGKTTLLKIVAGLLRPSSGEVLLHGRRVTGPPEEMALVFQEYGRSLMPWTSVRNNVLLPLRHKQLARSDRQRLVDEAVSAVGLDGFAERFPWQLSGGMQQRVAIARALAYQPSILLMDEPFASVDAQTRGDLEDLVLRVREEFGVTILFVTHDIDESVYLSDRIVVLTQSPTEVKEMIPVDLPHPRDQIATKELAEFAHLRAHVYRLIKREQQPVATLAAAEG